MWQHRIQCAVYHEENTCELKTVCALKFQLCFSIVKYKYYILFSEVSFLFFSSCLHLYSLFFLCATDLIKGSKVSQLLPLLPPKLWVKSSLKRETVISFWDRYSCSWSWPSITHPPPQLPECWSYSWAQPHTPNLKIVKS